MSLRFICSETFVLNFHPLYEMNRTKSVRQTNSLLCQIKKCPELKQEDVVLWQIISHGVVSEHCR